jgi:hypothetical protein
VENFLLKPKVTSALNLVILSGEENGLRSEIASQLITYKHLTVLNFSDYHDNFNQLKPDIFINFIPAFTSKSKHQKYF